jgi:hypothetical protein
VGVMHGLGPTEKFCKTKVLFEDAMQNHGFDGSNMVLHNRAINRLQRLQNTTKSQLILDFLRQKQLGMLFKTEITWNGMKIATNNTCEFRRNANSIVRPLALREGGGWRSWQSRDGARRRRISANGAARVKD